MKKTTALAPATLVVQQARVRRLPRLAPANATERAEGNKCGLCKKKKKEVGFVEIFGTFGIQACDKCLNRIEIAGKLLKKIGEAK